MPLGDTMADCLARVPKMSSVAINSGASRCSLRRRRAHLLAWVSNISLFVRVCQNKSLHLLSAKIERACRKILVKYFCFSLALCYLRTDSSVHAVGGWGRHFGKDVYERYLLPSNLANLNPRRYGNGNVHFGRLLHPAHGREAVGNGRL